jgi:hypothetical protein
MTWIIVLPFLTSLMTLIVAILTGLQSLRNGRKLQVVKDQTDGLAQALATTSLAQGTAEGKAVGLAEGRAEKEGNGNGSG